MLFSNISYSCMSNRRNEPIPKFEFFIINIDNNQTINRNRREIKKLEDINKEMNNINIQIYEKKSEIIAFLKYCVKQIQEFNFKTINDAEEIEKQLNLILYNFDFDYNEYNQFIEFCKNTTYYQQNISFKNNLDQLDSMLQYQKKLLEQFQFFKQFAKIKSILIELQESLKNRRNQDAFESLPLIPYGQILCEYCFDKITDQALYDANINQFIQDCENFKTITYTEYKDKNHKAETKAYINIFLCYVNLWIDQNTFEKRLLECFKSHFLSHNPELQEINTLIYNFKQIAKQQAQIVINDFLTQDKQQNQQKLNQN